MKRFLHQLCESYVVDDFVREIERAGLEIVQVSDDKVEVDLRGTRLDVWYNDRTRMITVSHPQLGDWIATKQTMDELIDYLERQEATPMTLLRDSKKR